MASSTRSSRNRTSSTLGSGAMVYPPGCKEVQEEMQVDELIRRLKVLASTFQSMGQEENAYDEYVPLCLHLAEEGFLNHSSRDIRLLIACCIADIFRIYAPEAPYKDSEQVKTIFKFLTSQLDGLKDPKDAAFSRYSHLLENLANVKSFNQYMQLDTCLGKHGSYTFYKSLRVGGRTLSLSNFFPVRIWPDSAILSIAEVQLLWKDRNETLCSLRLYFLPENTPYGRFSFHGEDEVIALQDKVIIRASDLMTWLVDEEDWDWGYLTPKVDPEQGGPISKGFLSQKYEKEDMLTEFNETRSDSVVVLNYDRYVRLRTVLKRLEGSPDMATWFNHPLVKAIGGVGLRPNCRLLFAKDVFDYPELEDHELLCNHLAPKLKGKQGRKKNRTRRPSMGSVSNESESSSTASSASTDKAKPRQRVNGMSSGHPHLDIRLPNLPLSHAARIMEERGLEALQRELLLSTNANGLQILKIDSSRIPKNGQIGSSSGGSGIKRSHNQQPLRVVDTRRGIGSSSSRGTAGMEFGPGLNELAQKLKRSNALQILAIRPPMGGGGMNDFDMFQLKKRMKLDPEQEILSTLLGSDLCIHPLNSGPFTSRKHTIYGAPIIDKVVSKTHEVVKQLVGFGQSQKSSTNKKIIQGQDKPHKEPVTPANIDADLREFMAIRTPSCVDSPFRTNSRIYVNPTADRFHLPDGVPSHFAQEDSGSVLDFSVRRSRQQNQLSDQITRRALSARVTQEPVDLLDLTLKPTSFGGRGTHESSLYGRQGGNISLPNPMDKLGLQLTSEVTLFPSPSYLGKVKENKSASGGKGTSPSASLVSKMSSGVIAGSSGSRSKSSKSPAAASGKVIHGASGSGGGRASASPKDVNSLRHHPYSSQHHPHMYPNHLNTKPVFGPPGLSHSPGGHSSSSAITIKPMTSSSEEKQNASKLKELEKAYQSLPSAAASFMPAPGNFGVPPKVDPSYLSLLANPFLMSPQALMSIPGAMEQFQMYKDLFQQSGIPQFPLHWPPPGGPGGNERGSK